MMSEKREWRALPSAPGYLVSSRGEVYSSFRSRELIPREVRGYMYVGITVNGVQYGRRVHRLVCEAFHGKSPAGKPLSLHGDGNPFNNTAANLRWGSHKDNAQDRTKHGRCHESRKTHCPGGHPYDGGNTYNRGGSRHCKTCAVEGKARDRRKGLAPGDRRHGTATGYFNHGCRCEVCRTAAREYNKTRRNLREGD